MTFRTGRALAIATVAALGFVAPQAFADDVSPASLALAKSVLSDVGLKGSLDSVVPTMLGQLEANLTRLHPEMRDQIREVIHAALPDFEKTEGSVLDDIAHVLASKMNDDELKATQAFFESPAGRKYLQSQAPVLQELGVSGGVWREKLATDMLERVRADMKKKGLTF